MNMPLPAALAAPTEFVLNKDIINEIQNVRPNFQKIERLLGEMRRLSLQPDKANLALEVGKRATELAVMIATDPENLKIVTYAERTARALNGLLDEADLQEAENRFFPMITWTYPRMCEKAKAGDKEAAKWVEAFRSMALLLRMYVPECLGSAQG